MCHHEPGSRLTCFKMLNTGRGSSIIQAVGPNYQPYNVMHSGLEYDIVYYLGTIQGAQLYFMSTLATNATSTSLVSSNGVVLDSISNTHSAKEYTSTFLEWK